MEKNLKTSYLALFVGAFLISFSPVLIRMTGAPGIASGFYRLLIGTITLIIPFGISVITHKSKISFYGFLLAFLAGLSFAIDMALWTTGIMISNAAMPTLVGNMAPIWVGIGAAIIFKEKNNKGFWAGLFVSFAGVAFLLLRDFYIPNGIFKGLILGLIAGMFYAAYILLTQPGRKILDTLSFLFLSTLSAAVFLGIFMVSMHIPFTGYSNKVWTIFIIMGICIQAGAWFLINFAQGHLPASLVSPTLLAQPVIAGLIAFLMLGEQLNFYQILGGIVVVTGIYLVHFSRAVK